MDQIEFRKLKESGQLPSNEDLAAAETDITPDDRYEESAEVEELEEQSDEQEESEEEVDESSQDDAHEEDVVLSPKEKTAFEKRMERERSKLEEKLRKEIEEQVEGRYSKHKQAIEAIGGDPDKIIQAARDAQLERESHRLADQGGWSEEERRYYVDQKKQEQELKELRVQMQIHKLRDNPDYLGIDRMEREIADKIDRSNGALSVEEAFWALGGPKRVEQVKLEAQQREIAKRNQQPRTVIKDTPSTSTGEKPLPASVLKDAKLMGISESEARRLYNSQSAHDIDAWREQRKKQKA